MRDDWEGLKLKPARTRRQERLYRSTRKALARGDRTIVVEALTDHAMAALAKPGAAEAFLHKLFENTTEDEL